MTTEMRKTGVDVVGDMICWASTKLGCGAGAREKSNFN
jgi:hypothetical protein